MPGRNTKFWRYEARLRPWTHYMTLRSNCRLWQKTSVPDIIGAILEHVSRIPSEFRLSRGYRAWEYCVQYQETDFNFMCRLLEHEGIYYYFEHSSGSHKLVFADDIGAHATLPGYAKIPHLPSDKMVVPDEEFIDDLQMVQEVESGSYATNDYDFKHPSANLKAAPPIDPSLSERGQGGLRVAGWLRRDQLGRRNMRRTRLEELQRPKEVVTAHSTVRGLAPGYLFTLERCPRRDQNREYLLLLGRAVRAQQSLSHRHRPARRVAVLADRATRRRRPTGRRASRPSRARPARRRRSSSA